MKLDYFLFQPLKVTEILKCIPFFCREKHGQEARYKSPKFKTIFFTKIVLPCAIEKYCSLWGSHLRFPGIEYS